jgi:hypothetical protein
LSRNLKSSGNQWFGAGEVEVEGEGGHSLRSRLELNSVKVKSGYTK